MANKNVEQFIATYGPVAQQVSKEINVDPNVLLSQWGLESRWGQTDMAKKHHNLGGIKDFSGNGFEAKDNKTGFTDKYVKFEDPEVFGMYYVDQIKRNFPGAVNTGLDVGAFTRGLASGKKGSYFEIPPEEYLKSLTDAQSALPESKEPPAKQDDGELKLGPPPPPPPPPPAEKSGAGPAEKFLFGGAGAAVGSLATGKSAYDVQRTATLAKRAGAEEAARIAAQRAAVPPGAPGVQGPSVIRQPGAPAAGGLPTPVGPADAGRMAKGQTGAGVYNYAKNAGLTDIEAGRALDMTKQTGGVHDLSTQRRENLNKVQSMFPGEKYVENPRFGGLLTPDQGGGRGPRASYVYQGPSELPPGQIAGPAAPPPAGSLVQLPRTAPIPTTPPPPSFGAKVMSGLDTVTNMFKGMMRPVVSAVGTVGKYALPPAAGLSAGLDIADIAHEYDKPADQRDLTKMALKGVSALGGGLSMFPPAALVGIPLSLGATAAQAYREDPEYFKQKMKEYTGYSP
jgi:hypothetical protein